ncbi:dynamin family protein [Pseudanabaenaceae cyanobacterium LEGE 13415]|nr:dynamin family protein [Pseudanabaenaceae cyanobacterium LEGE 13415]
MQQLRTSRDERSSLQWHDSRAHWLLKAIHSCPMVVSSVDRSHVAPLLSQVLGKPITAEKIPKLWIFLVALSAILVGVTQADAEVTDAETQRLKTILGQFMPAKSDLIQVVRLLIRGVGQTKLHQNLSDLGKLTDELSTSERLLLCAFGCELATADGSIDKTEQKYLHAVSDRLQIPRSLFTVLEQSFIKQPVSDIAAVTELRCLLAPSHFQVLDPVFANAANQLLEKLPQASQAQNQSSSGQLKFEGLAQDQIQRRRIEACCRELTELINSIEHESFDQALSEIAQLTEKVRSQSFRVAVVGEFSQGKSTLLNALLGEKIQPTRVIPCSGTITVLRYGERKRVICRYRDGSEAEISAQDYQEKAAISIEAALNHRDVALSDSAIEEIIYEHPGLQLCRSGVEVIDSPGLNEHPERTRITQKLLQSADAVIFLVNATRPLTQSERELLISLKTQLNAKADEPAENLFVLVNFVDLLREEQDREQVRQLVKNFVCEGGLILQENRLFFISAQSALDVILKAEHNEYLEMLQQFTQSLEQFLTVEKGEIKHRQNKRAIDQIAEQISIALSQTQENIALSVAAKLDILEKLGEASGYCGRLQAQIQTEISTKLPEVRSRASNSLGKDLEQRITEEARSWSSTETEKSKIIKDFSERFQADTQKIAEAWTKEIIVEQILSSSIKSINANLYEMIHQFQESAESIDKGTGSQLVRQLSLNVERVAPGFKLNVATEDVDLFDTLFRSGIGGGIGLGAGGVLAGGAALAVTSIAFFPVVLTGAAIAGIAVGGAALGTAISSALGFFTPPDQDDIKKEVLQKGFEQFKTQNLESQWIAAIEKLTQNLFEQRLQIARIVTDRYITSLNSLLSESDANSSLTVEAAQAKKQRYEKHLADLKVFRSQLQSV